MDDEGASVVKPFVLLYLSAIGIYILVRGIMYPPQIKEAKLIAPLGLFGGFLDAAGGGGWGPVVTSNLLIQGADPRKVVGTVNTVEFFLTLTISATFIWHLGFADVAAFLAQLSAHREQVASEFDRLLGQGEHAATSASAQAYKA